MHADLEVDAAQAAELIDGGDVQLVDVREVYEHEAGRIAGSRRIGLMELSGVADSLDPDRPVLFYCRVGSRSLMAAQAFARAGYDARSLAGGLVAWQQSGRPLEPAGGEVAPH